MAALFTRPAAPAPDAVEFTSAVSGGAALASTLQETALATAGIAMVEDPSGIAAEAPSTEAAADAATQAAQASPAYAAKAAQEARRLASSGGAEVGVSDAGATPAFEAETPTIMMDAEQGGVSRRAPASTSTETASTPLGLLEGTNDVEAVDLIPARGAAQPSTRSDANAADDGLAAMRAAVNGASMAATREGADVAAADATKANALPTVPVTTQVAETVRAALMRGDHEIRLVLNPGDLGQITVRIVEQGGALHLRLDATKAATHDLLARELPGLRQALETRDLRVERIQVSHSGSPSADGSGTAWQQGSSRQGQQQDRDGSPAWSPVAALDSARNHLEGRRAPRLIRHEVPRHIGVLDRVA